MNEWMNANYWWLVLGGWLLYLAIIGIIRTVQGREDRS